MHRYSGCETLARSGLQEFTVVRFEGQELTAPWRRHNWTDRDCLPPTTERRFRAVSTHARQSGGYQDNTREVGGASSVHTHLEGRGEVLLANTYSRKTANSRAELLTLRAAYLTDWDRVSINN